MEDSAQKRYRCTACGNLTRFDVTMTRRTRTHREYGQAGDVLSEDVDVLEETIEDIVCLWCGPSGKIEMIPNPTAPSTN